jgi:hypothetical protein
VITWDITQRKNMQFHLEQANGLLQSISVDLPVIIFNVNNKGIISDIEGKGLKLIQLKDKKTAQGELLRLFPDIKKSIADKKEKDSYTAKGVLKIDKTEFGYKYLLLKSKSTTDGYSGYILLERK